MLFLKKKIGIIMKKNIFLFFKKYQIKEGQENILLLHTFVSFFFFKKIIIIIRQQLA
jgi:hypothetical protein